MAKQIWCHPSRSTSRALQWWWRRTVEAPRSRLLKWLMWAGHEALAEDGWTLESNSRSPASFTAFLPCGIAPPLMACQHSAHLSSLSPNTLSLGTILDSSLFLLGSVYISYLLWRTIFSTPSFVHMHTASHSSWGVSSIHQALCWTLMLIISNPHSNLHSKYWPHFTGEETEKLRSHHWSEGGQLLNRRAGIWMSSCQFRVFCSFISGCPGGDWRAYLKWR